VLANLLIAEIFDLRERSMQSGEHDVPADVAEGSKDADRQIKRQSAQTALSQSLRGPLSSTRHAFRNITTIGRTI